MNREQLAQVQLAAAVLAGVCGAVLLALAVLLR